MAIDPQQNRVYGAVFGQAIGDAIGHPVEFEKTHMVSGLETPNQFTDDTQMFCAIGEALLAAPPHKDEAAFMDALKARFLEWRKTPLGGNHRAPGGTYMEAVRKMGAKVDWKKSGATARGKGNGSAMRSGVIGALYWQSPDYAFRIGCLTSVPTHNNLEAILGSGMVSFLVASLVAGAEFPQAIADGINLCSFFEQTVPGWPTNNLPLNDDEDGQSVWKTVASFGMAYAYGVSKLEIKDYTKFNGDDFTVVPAVSEAIFYNARFGNYKDIAVNAVNFGDDADTIAAISGTIAGSRFGLTKMPPEWVKGVELYTYLADLSNRLWKASLDIVVQPDKPSEQEGEYEIEL
jgi:ADP-ribosylglycohydrolase